MKRAKNGVVMSATECVNKLRKNGIPYSVKDLVDEIERGELPFGKIINPTSTETAKRCVRIYTVDFLEWLKSRMPEGMEIV